MSFCLLGSVTFYEDPEADVESDSGSGVYSGRRLRAIFDAIEVGIFNMYVSSMSFLG